MSIRDDAIKASIDRGELDDMSEDQAVAVLDVVVRGLRTEADRWLESGRQRTQAHYQREDCAKAFALQAFARHLTKETES